MILLNMIQDPIPCFTAIAPLRRLVSYYLMYANVERAWVASIIAENNASTIVICQQTARQIMAPRKLPDVL